MTNTSHTDAILNYLSGVNMVVSPHWLCLLNISEQLRTSI